MFKVDGFETIKGQWRLFCFKEVNLFMLRSYVDVIFGAVRDTSSLPAVEQGLLLLGRESSSSDSIILQDDLPAKKMLFYHLISMGMSLVCILLWLWSIRTSQQ